MINKVIIKKDFQILMIDLLLHNQLENLNKFRDKKVKILLFKGINVYKKIMKL